MPHADLHWYALPRRLAGLAATGLILKRRKKPFDLITAPDEPWQRWMTALRWLHRADVVNEHDEEQFTRLWTQRSRSRSSS